MLEEIDDLEWERYNNLFQNILKESKENKKILNLYYDDLYFYISLIQISVISVSSLTAFFQGFDSFHYFPGDFLKIFTLSSSTYITLILALAKFFKLDEKKERINNLTSNYSKIHNRIKMTLDKIKPWKDIFNHNKEEWETIKIELEKEYLDLISDRQEITTEYENIMYSEKRIRKYRSQMIEEKQPLLR